ncbi:MAG: hypothetical protein AAGK97_08975, partial [Bacteroidota bacterium]
MENNKANKSFFQELKERRFFTYFFSYILASFAVIQFVDWYATKYEMSNHLPTMAMVFLAAVFPSYLIFAWYHGKPGPDPWRPFEKIFIPANVIAALGLVFFLFSGRSLQAATETITIKDEEGKEVERVVPKANFTHRIAMFPLKTLGGITEEDKDIGGIATLLQMEDLEQDNRLYGINPINLKEEASQLGHDILSNDLPYSVQRKIAEVEYAEFTSSGTINKDAEGNYIVKTLINNVADSKVFFEKEFKGKDLYKIIDDFTSEFRSSLILSEASQNAHNEMDLPCNELLTSDMESLKSYYKAMVASNINNDYGSAFQLMNQSIERDPKFAKAYLRRAGIAMSVGNQPGYQDDMKKALEYSQSLPERAQLNIKSSYLISKQQLEKAISLLEMWTQLYPKDYVPYSQLFYFYSVLSEINKAVSVGERALHNGHESAMGLRLASLYNRVGKFEEAKNITDNFIKSFPNRAKENYQVGDIFMEQGEFDKAEEHYEKIALLKPTDYFPLLKLGNVQGKKLNFKEQAKYYKQALEYA